MVEPGEVLVIYKKISAKRQVSLGKEVLEHLGVKPGDKIDCELRQDRTIVLMAYTENWQPSTKEDP